MPHPEPKIKPVQFAQITEEESDRPIILLDLVWTLAYSRSHTGRSFASNLATELYRKYLLDALAGHYIILHTARTTRWQPQTLGRIKDQTGWEPHAAVFNQWGCQPPIWKRAAMRRLIWPRFPRDRFQFLAIESNGNTRQMYDDLKIPNTRWEDFCSQHKIAVPRSHPFAKGWRPKSEDSPTEGIGLPPDQTEFIF